MQFDRGQAVITWESLDLSSLCVTEKNKDSCKRENVFLIPMLPSKNSGSQEVCPLQNRDHRREEVNQGPYIAQGQGGRCIEIQEAEQLGTCSAGAWEGRGVTSWWPGACCGQRCSVEI